MTTLDLIAQTAKDLPPDKQQEILDFIEFLRSKERPNGPLRDLYGILAGVGITEEDIAEARKEMWGSFPKALPE